MSRVQCATRTVHVILLHSIQVFIQFLHKGATCYTVSDLKCIISTTAPLHLYHTDNLLMVVCWYNNTLSMQRS